MESSREELLQKLKDSSALEKNPRRLSILSKRDYLHQSHGLNKLLTGTKPIQEELIASLITIPNPVLSCYDSTSADLLTSVPILDLR